MKVVLLSGSSQKHSHTLALAKTIAAELINNGAESEVIDIVELGLPAPDTNFHKNPEDHPDQKVRDLAAKVNQADAIILLSPVYHNSYSGTLKTALDHLAIKNFMGKPMAFGSHGGNRTTQPIDQLRIVARGLNAIGLPSQVCTTEEDYIEADDGYELVAEDIKERIEGIAASIVEVTAKLNR